MNRVVAFLGILAVAAGIGVPLTPMVSRCMVAYTDDSYETLKLDVKFPPIPNQVEGEVYQIEIYNTETHQTLYESIANGKYRKEMDLDESNPVLTQTQFTSSASRW